MISQLNGSMVRDAYSNTLLEPKQKSKSADGVITKQGDTSKIEKIKQSLDSGDYKIDLESLSRKIANELI